jgi:hypothetical protein
MEMDYGLRQVKVLGLIGLHQAPTELHGLGVVELCLELDFL